MQLFRQLLLLGMISGTTAPLCSFLTLSAMASPCSACDLAPPSVNVASPTPNQSAQIVAPRAVYTGYDPTQQTAEQWINEARTVYLGNLERRAHGAGPLRWNRELTKGARWFSFDSVENRLDGYCGHQDTLGTWPGDRVTFFGYRGGSGAENAFCGYLPPADAINGWMNSEGHRANLLDPQHREIGLGYYLRTVDGRGYVTQDFGADNVYPPVVINNEALNTTSANVSLYIHNNTGVGPIAGLGAIVQMMVSNRADFLGANWEPYTQEKNWTLEPGTGWRQVFVRMKDQLGRGVTVSDSIYLGQEADLPPLSFAQLSLTQPSVRLPNLNTQNLPQVMVSPGWMIDDQTDRFEIIFEGLGERVNDGDAVGGTAMRLRDGNGTTTVWCWTDSFPRNIPMVAFVRLKTSDNTISNEIANFHIEGGLNDYGPVSIKGTEFTSPTTYQEFALPISFQPGEGKPFLTFVCNRTGTPDIYVDGVSIFTAPMPASTTKWDVPNQHYRGQALWLRYTDGNGYYTAIQAAFPLIEPDSLPVISISNAVSQNEGSADNPGAATFVMSLDQPTSEPVSVLYQTANGTATAGSDYVAKNGTLTFAPGETRKTVMVNFIGDSVGEANETFFVDLNSPTGATIGATPAGHAAAVILNDDAVATLAIGNVTLIEGNSGSKNAVFTVTLSAPTTQTVSVNAVPYDGTARAPADYTAGGAQLVFVPGETSKSFSVPIKGDLLDEPNETFYVVLSSPVNAAIERGRGRGMGTIQDDDASPAISIDNVSIGEGNSGQRVAVFRLNLSAPSGQVVKVSYATAGGSATPNNDYVTVTTTQIAFNANSTVAYARIFINGDALNEPNETFTVNLSNPINATITDNQALGTILNDDSPPALTINDATVTEGNDGVRNLTFTVTLSKISGQTVTVNYATTDGIARSTSDYNSQTGSLSFLAGQANKTVSIAVRGDIFIEGNETLYVLLSHAINASIGRGRGMGTILNDDGSG